MRSQRFSLRARWLAALFATSAAVLSVTACGAGGTQAPSKDCKPAHKFSTIKEGVLTVAVSPYMPSADVVDGKMVGIDAAIVNHFAKTECLSVRVTKGATAGVIPLVTSGRADVAIGDWYRTKQRAKIVGVSDPTYLDAPAVASYTPGLNSLDALVGKDVGDLQGNTWNDSFREIIGDGYRVYSNPQQETTDLVNRRLDAAVTTALYWGYQESQHPHKGLHFERMKPDKRVDATVRPPQSGIPFTKDNAALGKALNADIAKMRKNGELAKALEKYGAPKSLLDTGKPYLI